MPFADLPSTHPRNFLHPQIQRNMFNRGRSPLLASWPSTSLLPYARSRNLGPQSPYRSQHSALHALALYLPGLADHNFHSPAALNRQIAHWARTHPETQPSPYSQHQHHHPLCPADLCTAFELILSATAAGTPHPDPIPRASQYLLAALHAQRARDTALALPTTLAPVKCTQALFRSLAEISRATASRPLARVLQTFLLAHLAEIAGSSPPRALAQWCWALGRAHLRDEERQFVLGKVLGARPEFVRELEGEGSERCRGVARMFERLQLGEGGEDGLLRPRGLSWVGQARSYDRFGLGDEEDELFGPRGLRGRDHQDQARYLDALRDDLRYHEERAERDREEILLLRDGRGYGGGLLEGDGLGRCEWVGERRSATDYSMWNEN